MHLAFGALGGECFSIESADVVGGVGAPNHPAFIGGISVHGQLEQIGALEHSLQHARLLPVFQVTRFVEIEPVLSALRFVVNDEHPFFLRRIPKDHRVARAAAAPFGFGGQRLEHHVGIENHGHAAVGAGEYALCKFVRRVAAVVRGEDERGLSGAAQAGGVFHVHGGSARPERILAAHGIEQQRPFLPMQQVAAGRVAPRVVRAGHEVGEAGVRVAEVPLAVEIDHPRWIIEPSTHRREVNLRASRFVVERILSGDGVADFHELDAGLIWPTDAHGDFFPLNQTQIKKSPEIGNGFGNRRIVSGEEGLAVHIHEDLVLSIQPPCAREDEIAFVRSEAACVVRRCIFLGEGKSACCDDERECNDKGRFHDVLFFERRDLDVLQFHALHAEEHLFHGEILAITNHRALSGDLGIHQRASHFLRVLHDDAHGE